MSIRKRLADLVEDLIIGPDERTRQEVEQLLKDNAPKPKDSKGGTK